MLVAPLGPAGGDEPPQGVAVVPDCVHGHRLPDDEAVGRQLHRLGERLGHRPQLLVFAVGVHEDNFQDIVLGHSRLPAGRIPRSGRCGPRQGHPPQVRLTATSACFR